MSESKIQASLSVGNQVNIHLSLDTNEAMTIDSIIKGASLAIVNLVHKHKISREEILNAFKTAVGEAYDEVESHHAASRGPKLVKQ